MWSKHRPQWLQHQTSRASNVEVQEEGRIEVRDCALGEPGELLVRGPAVFKEYLFRDDATRKAFDGEWFKTGDTAVRERVIFPQ